MENRWGNSGNSGWLYFFGLQNHCRWPPDVKSWLTGKDPDAGKDWGQEEKGTTEDEMAGWHHRLNGHEFGWTLGVGDGQGGLVCCGPCSRKESDTTEWLNWTELNWTELQQYLRSLMSFFKILAEKQLMQFIMQYQWSSCVSYFYNLETISHLTLRLISCREGHSPLHPQPSLVTLRSNTWNFLLFIILLTAKPPLCPHSMYKSMTSGFCWECWVRPQRPSYAQNMKVGLPRCWGPYLLGASKSRVLPLPDH